MTIPLTPAAGPLPTPLSTAPATDVLAGPPLPASATCANCLAPLFGHYCGECGAPRLDDRPVTVRRFVGELVNEVTNVDSVTMRTLRSLLTRPGELTREYLAGRTRWYLTPLRVYALLFAVLLFGQAMLPDPDGMYRQLEARLAAKGREQQAALRETLARAHATPNTRQQIVLRLDPAESAAQTVAGMRIQTENEWLQLVNALPWAMVLAALYWRRRRNFAEHLVFAMHLLAFNFVLLLLDRAARSVLHMGVGDFDWLTWTHLALVGGYFFLATRRLYAESRPKAAAKSVLFVAGAQASMALLGMAAFLYAGVKIAQREAHERPAVPAPATAPAPR